MERQIGDKFSLDGIEYEVVRHIQRYASLRCDKCAFNRTYCAKDPNVCGFCNKDYRKDGKPVYFRRVKK